MYVSFSLHLVVYANKCDAVTPRFNQRSMRLETVGDYEKDPIVEAVYVYPTSNFNLFHTTARPSPYDSSPSRNTMIHHFNLFHTTARPSYIFSFMLTCTHSMWYAGMLACWHVGVCVKRQFNAEKPARELKESVLVRTHSMATMLSSVGVRTQQTTMGTLLTSALRDSLNVDVCCLNAGNIRGSTSYPHEFTWFDLRIEIAFPTYMAICTCSLPLSFSPLYFLSFLSFPLFRLFPFLFWLDPMTHHHHTTP